MFDEFKALALAALALIGGGAWLSQRAKPTVATTSTPAENKVDLFPETKVTPLVEGPWASFEKFAASASDVDALARTLYGEARGEGVAGMEAVASVILNRVFDRRWPDRIKGVCLQSKQFSTWNFNDSNRRKALGVQVGDALFDKCLSISTRAFNGQLRDATGGANHFHTAAIDPSWNRRMNRTARIGAHIFWRG